MSIEIKQLLIKSNIVQKAGDDGEKPLDQSALAAGLLEQCRSLVLEMLNEKRER